MIFRIPLEVGAHAQILNVAELGLKLKVPDPYANTLFSPSAYIFTNHPPVICLNHSSYLWKGKVSLLYNFSCLILLELCDNPVQ